MYYCMLSGQVLLCVPQTDYEPCIGVVVFRKIPLTTSILQQDKEKNINITSLKNQNLVS